MQQQNNKTLIQISDVLWEYLNSHKTRDCKTFEEVIWGFIKLEELNKNGGKIK